MTDKSRNEHYFNRLGAENASRPENLPPSQGGRYAGFGNSPAVAPRNNPSMDVNDMLNDPAAALSMGWNILSSTLAAGATMINENVIKPTAATVTDPDFQNKVGGYVSSIGQKVRKGRAKAFCLQRIRASTFFFFFFLLVKHTLNRLFGLALTC